MSCVDRINEVRTSTYASDDLERWEENYGSGWRLTGGTRYPSFIKD